MDPSVCCLSDSFCSTQHRLETHSWGEPFTCGLITTHTHTHTHTHSSSLLSRRSHHFTICRNHVISVLVVLLCDSNHSRIRTTSTKNHDSQTWVCATFHWVSSPETWTFHGMLNEIRRCCLDITSGAQHALILQLALALALVFNLWRPVFGRSRQLLKVNYRCEVAVYLCREADTWYLPRGQVSSVANWPRC